MIGRTMRWTVTAMACYLAASVGAQPSAPSSTRGELLYKTHCVSCHTTEVHWRERRLATDWNSLQAQVRRWQRNNGLKWSDQEIVDVARYLNGQFYHFAPPARQAQEEVSRLAASAMR